MDVDEAVLEQFKIVGAKDVLHRLFEAPEQRKVRIAFSWAVEPVEQVSQQLLVHSKVPDLCSDAVIGILLRAEEPRISSLLPPLLRGNRFRFDAHTGEDISVECRHRIGDFFSLVKPDKVLLLESFFHLWLELLASPTLPGEVRLLELQIAFCGGSCW